MSEHVDPDAPGLADLDHALRDVAAKRRARRAAATANFGPRGFGHVQDRSALVETEAAAIRDAVRLILADETISSVVHDWNDRGLRTTTGGLWRVNSMSALLIQPRLAGLHVDARGNTTARWPAIIDRPTHEALVALRTSRSSLRRPPRRSLLSGVLRCGRCKGVLHYLHRSEANQYYRCPAPAAGGCSGVIVKARFVEAMVRDLVLARVDDPGFLATARDVLGPVDAAGDDVRALASEIEQDTARLKELAALWADQQITRVEWQQARAEIARRLNANEASLRRFDSMKSTLALAGRGADLAGRWAAMSVEDKRDVILAVVEYVVVEPVGGTGGKFRPERVAPVWRRV